MRELKQIPLSQLPPDPNQPRKAFDKSVILALTDSIKAVGVQVPLIVIEVRNDEEGGIGFIYRLVDGGCRRLAAIAAGLVEVPCIVLKETPSPANLICLRLAIDVNRSSLKPLERAAALCELTKLTGLTLVEACKRAGISQSLGSKLVALMKLAPELQQKVNEGMDIERAYVISQTPDFQKQIELATSLAGLSREQLRRKVRSTADAPEVKVAVARFQLPKGMKITVQGQKMTVAGVIDLLLETVKQLKKGQAENWDLLTCMRVFRDRANSPD